MRDSTTPSFFSTKGLGGELLAEFMGTLILILFGDGVVAVVLLFLGFNASGPNGAFSGTASWLLINFGWGFAVMLGVYVAGTLTGAHINPAVTLAMALRRGFPWAKVAPYWGAQFLGAFIAAAILYVEYNTGFFSVEQAGTPKTSTGSVFYTNPHTAIGGTVVPIPNALFDQILGTALLVFLILAIVDVLNAPPQSNLAPFIIGLVVVAIGMSFGTNAGYAINPARDFGPRVFAWIAGWGAAAIPGNGPGYSNYFWVPIVGPLVGGAIGAYVYDYTIHALLKARSAPEAGVMEEGRTVVETDRARVRPEGRTVEDATRGPEPTA
ncbi:MAG: MIP/aquaporin family protein [Ktedonobacterales bacterium]